MSTVFRLPVTPETMLAVGTAAARISARLWLRDQPGAREAVTTVANLLERKLRNPFERATARREFERIAEDIAARLTPYFETEFSGGLPDNELEAAALTLTRALEMANPTDEDLFAVDLEPIALEKLIRAQTDGMVFDALLSDAAGRLYDLALRETCNYVVEINLSLAPFHGAALREVLRRETELLQLVKEALDRLPGVSKQSVFEDPDKSFDREYARQVARKLDKLELFGVDSYLSTRFALSVAYITLAATPIGEKRADEAPIGDDEAALAFLPVDAALRDEKRVLLRGEAGSGKTTLLQWLAVNSARGSFVGSLEGWNKTIPFFIQLRRYADSDLPRPERFVDAIAPTIAGDMPEGWVHHHLRSGRALVLIDGVDEYPSEKRDAVRLWVEELRDSFPQSRYVVTSRPPAAAEAWLDGSGFVHTDLQPMTASDIRAFIRHWHSALEATVPDEDLARDVRGLRDDMQRLIREQASLQALATSPLLCALLCAMHRERRSQLPRDRVQLYRIALEMLLERRDVERKALVDDLALTLSEKELLLEALAYSFNINRASDIQRRVAVQILERQLRAMPHVRATAAEVFDHLLLRSGLLREPIPGRIDFVHRTFQEYLAAKEALDQNHVGLLVDKAHEDEWSETIILAAGLAQAAQREALISGVVARGDQEPALRHRLHVLAAACLETSPRLSPELATELRKRLAGVVPPRSLTEARSVASAGDLATPLLARRDEWRAVECAAAVRALGLIGSEAAFGVVATYGRDRRVTVTRELIRSWSAFDPIAYAEIVLGESPLDNGGVDVDDPALLPGLPLLSRLRRLRCSIDGSSVDLAPLRSIDAAIELSLWGFDGHSLGQLAGVRRLNLLRVTSDTLESLTGVEETRIRNLEIAGCHSVVDISALASASETLERAVLDASRVSDLSPLAGAQALSRLECSWCHEISDLEPVAAIPALEWLDVRGSSQVEDLTPIGRQGKIRVLWLDGCTQISSLEGLTGLTGLDRLEVGNCPDLRDLHGLEGIAVKRLNATGCVGLESLSGLARGETLTQIKLTGCVELVDIAALALAANAITIDLRGCRRLASLPVPRSKAVTRQIFFDRCVSLQTVEALREMPHLEMVSLAGCSALEDIEALRDHPSLSTLLLSGCTTIEDLSPLQSVSTLRYLSLAGCRQDLDWQWLREALPRVEIRPPGSRLL